MSAGRALRDAIAARPIHSFIGVYDVFSATLAARHFDGLFVSGLGFAASHHGLPDVGFVTWSDIVAFVQRLRVVLPAHHIIVDIDDGYGDPEVAAHVAVVLERAGASAVVLEDQRRPRRCGHVAGKQILELDDYLAKLRRVLAARRDLVVIARTDATDDAERVRRACAFDDAGADAVLVDGVERLELLRHIAQRIDRPLMFNQIAGGKSPRCTLSELREAGVSLVNYSTPCLFAAHDAIDAAMARLKAEDGILPAPAPGGASVAACTALLNDNLLRSQACLAPPAPGPASEAPAPEPALARGIR
jgi:2-methylisocitrate lyase-like PEP mutase family enzyme